MGRVPYPGAFVEGEHPRDEVEEAAHLPAPGWLIQAVKQRRDGGERTGTGGQVK
jgi:hypothetical protein